jgi:predicted ATPase
MRMSEQPILKAPTRSSSGKPPNGRRSGKIRLAALTIHNFKAFDDFRIEFPPPRMQDDPDILVMGSSNGLGKTSILEACSMLFIAATFGEPSFGLRRYSEVSVDLLDLMIRGGANDARITGNFTINDKPVDISLNLTRTGKISIEGDTQAFQRSVKRSEVGSQADTRDTISKFSLSLVGLNSDPLLLPPLIYFHSYRKVQEGSLELGRMVGDDEYRRLRYTPGREITVSTFKVDVLRSMMGSRGLFENLDDSVANDTLSKVNDLMKQYAGGYIEKLRPLANNTVEFRVAPSNGGPSFTFDGLSSGQKEIISTLFLIWRYTQNQPGIILIDEPELHLNVEWHRGIIRHLHQLAPDNQYIIATHSEDIVSAVDKDRRILLVPDKKES